MASKETGLDAWLRYAPLPPSLRKSYKPFSKIIALSSNSKSPISTAAKELQAGIKGILGQELTIATTLQENEDTTSTILISTLTSYPTPSIPELKEDGYHLSTHPNRLQILGQNERGALYGTFAYLSLLARGEFTEVAYASSPSAPIRWANEWDNLDGSIERGYGGKSIFFAQGRVLEDLSRVGKYARLLASLGINGVVVVC